jgi:predicted nucleic acid-binding protein
VIVVDASAAVLGLLNNGDARALLRAESVASPHLVDPEVAHALRAQVQRGRIDATTAERALERWARLAIERISVVGLLSRIWSLRANLSAYDAAYVSVAEALGCALLTADGRLARAPGVRCRVTVVRG